MPGRSKDLESSSSNSFGELLLDRAKKYGFPLAGAIDIDLTLIEKDIKSYDQWIASGFSGAMSYLVRGRDRRADPRLVLPGAQSILCVAQPYSAQPAGQLDSTFGPRYSRYLRSSDYHEDITERLEVMMDDVAQNWSQPLEWKVCVDTSAVLERSWAALAGLGWIGKNTMFIHPQFGSYLFLGEVLISEKTGRGPSPLPNYCGSCTRCLNVCPPQAFSAPHVLDANRCISYLTLEKRGAFEISEEHKKKLGTWVAGCDLCQEVCPFNTKVTKKPLTSEEQAISLNTWRDLLLEEEAQYRARVKKSSLSRVKPSQFSRNLANALRNAIAGAITEDSREVIFSLLELIRKKIEKESDPVSRQEWELCLQALQQCDWPNRRPKSSIGQ